MSSTPDPESDSDGPSNGYERFLWDLADGRPVRTGLLIGAWLLLIGAGAAVVFLGGGRSESDYMAAVAVVSVPYWAVGVPIYVSKRYRGSGPTV